MASRQGRKAILSQILDESVYRALLAYNRLQRKLEPGFEIDQTPLSFVLLGKLKPDAPNIIVLLGNMQADAPNIFFSTAPGLGSTVPPLRVALTTDLKRAHKAYFHSE